MTDTSEKASSIRELFVTESEIVISRSISVRIRRHIRFYHGVGKVLTGVRLA